MSNEMSERPSRRQDERQVQSARRPVNRRRKKRKSKKNNNSLRIMVVVLSLILLLLIIFGIRSCTKISIEGRWELDNDTVYVFKEKGRGTLVLPSMRFDFKYRIRGDDLIIDFEDNSRAKDAQYDIIVENGYMFWDGGTEDGHGNYVLRRKLR